MTDQNTPRSTDTKVGVHYVEIVEDRAGQRIDNFLLGYFKDIPRSHVYRLLRTGEVRINGKRAKADKRLEAGDKIRIPPVRLQATEQSAHSAHVGDKNLKQIKQAIIYEDAKVIVLNKPVGLAVHGGSGVTWGVIEGLRQLYPNAELALVHRLDRDTSGCLIIAKKYSVLRDLHRALREHEVEKTYLALVKGRWPKRLQQVNQPLNKNILRSGERVVSISAEGKPALTYFQVEQHFQETTLLKVRIVTGRTHQIRVHTAFAGHPIVGDDKYGDKVFNKQMRGLGLRRMFLHAQTLELKLPGEKNTRTFVAPIDEQLTRVIQCLTETNK